MCNKYKVIIPLNYNKNEFKQKSIENSSSCVYILKNPIIVKYKNNCNIIIKTDVTNIEKKLENDINSINFICEFTKIQSESENELIFKITPIIINICKELTYYISKSNKNKQSFHPRIIPEWKKLSIETLSTEFDKLTIRDSLNLTIGQYIDINGLDIQNWINYNNTTYSFIMNEYYLASGEENIKSKFFHLFTIIEFCEKEFESENKAVKLLNADLISKIEDNVKNLILGDTDNKNNTKIIARLKQTLSELTDINRVEKIINILNWMEIHSIELVSNEIDIDKSLINNLIILRNKSYHGDKDNFVDRNFVSYVLKLMLICEQIISFLKKAIKNNNYYLITKVDGM